MCVWVGGGGGPQNINPLVVPLPAPRAATVVAQAEALQPRGGNDAQEFRRRLRVRMLVDLTPEVLATVVNNREHKRLGCDLGAVLLEQDPRRWSWPTHMLAFRRSRRRG